MKSLFRKLISLIKKDKNYMIELAKGEIDIKEIENDVETPNMPETQNKPCSHDNCIT